jgi:hypothetical protein
MADILVPLDFKPGIQRDGTGLDSDRALDALWCRWRLGRPRKMGGYSRFGNTLTGVPRKIHMFYQDGSIYVHVGTASSLQQFVLDTNGALLSTHDRTPATLASGPTTGWTLDALFDTTSSAVQLVAHAAPDLQFAASSGQSVPFIGQITATTPLVPFSDPGSYGGGSWAQPNIAGGVFCVQPYVFAFDKFGFIQWSAPNLPLQLGTTGGTLGSGSARISAQKLIAGLPLRGGATNSPAALIWSLSEVITATFVGQAAGIFAFNTISPSSSILSTDCVMEYDGMYYWPAIDRFLVYNGTVQEVPNSQNQDWFFNNINRTYSAKTFAFKIPRYGEIWWCAPMFGNTEPSHAVIYNVREQCWYDTVLPGSGRTCGYFAQGFRYPIMGEPALAGGYKLWLHEIGVDSVEGGASSAVRSYFETPYFAATKLQQPSNEGLSIDQFEPDIIQTGNMSVTVTGAYNPRGGDFSDPPVTMLANPTVPQEQLTSFRSMRRLPRLHIESNTMGGNFIVGRNIVHATKPKDTRITS